MVGYDFIIRDRDKSIPLTLLKAISPLLDVDAHSTLENTIYSYRTPYEKDNPKYRGSYELTLWQQMDSAKLSQKSKLRIEELERKFPERKLSLAQPLLTRERQDDGFLSSPVPTRAFEKMTDEQWIQ